MRIAICDDERRELDRLSDLLKEYQDSRNIQLDCRAFQNGTDLLCGMKGGEYDLIALDVLMPGFTGIQVARELRSLDQNVKLLFLTSSPEFALESYAVGAYHYLLKPATRKSLFPLLDKARSELAAQEVQGLMLRDRYGVVCVPFSKLEYVEVMNKTVSFHLVDGVVREVSAALSDFEAELLARPEFLKIHRSYLANLSYLQAVSAKGAVTRTGHTIPVSRLQYNQIKDAYMRFLFETKSQSHDSAPQAGEKESVIGSEQPAGPWSLLLVDDEPAELSLWAGILRSHGCVVAAAERGDEALELASSGRWDGILLDVEMPGSDGFTLCERLRELTHAPIMFLSCHTETDKQLRGFAQGGADYITKDTPAELVWAKVETRIRLSGDKRTQLCFGPLLVDMAERRVLIEETELSLTPTEFDLLWRLCEHTERVFTPEELFRAVWGEQPWDGGQTVQVHMSRLRRKLEKAWNTHNFIETVWGQGYRFAPIAEKNCPAEAGCV